MKILYSWLLDYVPYQGTPQQLSEILTNLGMSVDSLTPIGAEYKGVVVGRIISCEKVAGSDHLSFCTVDVGETEPFPIVCGAPNVAGGQIVPVAVPGAMLPGGFLITERKLRGVLSRGMICSERELGLSDEHKGILVLPDNCEIGRPVQDYLGGLDWLFDLEVTFNRPDCLCHIGVAREICAKLELPLKFPEVGKSSNISTIKTSDWVSVTIDDPVKCPRYSAVIVKGVRIAPSPDWLQTRLKAIGIRPISNVVDVTNYVMMELGHPLHAFDYHLVKDGRIIVRRAVEGEQFRTLDDKEHTLVSEDLLIADPEKGIALAGVMGGLNTEINDTTTDVLIECAVFGPSGIRITSRDRGIGTESSRRFERGVDPELTLRAAMRAAELIQELSGGEILDGIVDSYPRKWKRPEITLRSNRVNAILASDLTPAQMRGYLDSLGCDQGSAVNDKKDGEIWQVYPPSWRRDLGREIDLIEEIIRLHGYNEVGMAERSQVLLEPDVERERRRRVTDSIRNALVSLGLWESVCWSLISAGDSAALNDGIPVVKVINPLSEDLSRLRTSLAPGLMRAMERNLNAGQTNIRLFEWGKCFRATDSGVAEGWKVGVILGGNSNPESFLNKERLLSYADVRGIVEQFFRRIKIVISIENNGILPDYISNGSFIASKEIGQIGVFGQIASKTTQHFGIDIPVWYIELDGELLLKNAGTMIRYQQLPRFPAAIRDLAFIVDETLDAGILTDCLNKYGAPLLERLDLFDIYTGRGIGDGKKSLAYHLTFRSLERTLSDNEVDEAVARMVTHARQNAVAELRSL